MLYICFYLYNVRSSVANSMVILVFVKSSMNHALSKIFKDFENILISSAH